MTVVKNEYMYNASFRAYVNEYCREHRVTTEEALELEEVKRVSRYYADL